MSLLRYAVIPVHRTVVHRGRTVIAMDCGLDGAEWPRWPAEEQSVRHHEGAASMSDGLARLWRAILLVPSAFRCYPNTR